MGLLSLSDSDAAEHHRAADERHGGRRRLGQFLRQRQRVANAGLPMAIQW